MMIVTPETSDSNKQFRYQIATITNRLGCSTSDTNNIAGTAVINTFGWPTPYAGPDIEFCDTTGVMNATQSYGNIQWQKLTGSNPVIFEHPQNPDTRVNVNITHEETFTFLLNETNWQCQSQDTLNVTFYFPPQPDAGEDIVLMFKRDTVLHADSLTHNETAYWEIIQGAGYIENDSSLSTEIHDLSYNEKNYITWNVKKGVCDVVSDTIKITILDMEIPTGFSPNNDGVNDRFFIKGLNESDKNELIVFNKWGNIVYSSKNYQNDWEGYNQNNKQLMEDTYFYVLKVKGEISSEKSGFIVIKR
jgi:gliding motility-associated-like protein